MIDSPTAHPTGDPAATYSAIARGQHASGERGRVIFCVSTDDIEEGKGDVFVALGLASQLLARGWGVALWPISKWMDSPEVAPDVAISMLDSFVPGFLPDSTATIAWVRNWTDTWADLPFLSDFDAVWSSSSASLSRLVDDYSGPARVVPIAVDTDLFRDSHMARSTPILTSANFWGADRGIKDALGAVAEKHPVIWYGANGEHLRASERIDHRPFVSFFDLPRLYSASLIVVDDLIPPAAAYGSHNSRLFEALACGALVVTSTRAGLDELGLGEVPTWASGDDLTATIDGLLAEPAVLRTRAERLARVVRDRHSYAARADDVDAALDEAIRSRADRPPRPAAYRWIGEKQGALRYSEAERDGHLQTVRRLEREIGEGSLREQEAGRAIAAYRSEAARLAAELERVHSSRTFRTVVAINGITQRFRGGH